MVVKHAPPQGVQSFCSLTPEQLRAVELLSFLDEEAFLDEKAYRRIMSRDVVEASKRGKSYSVTQLISLFGSFANALLAAGIGVHTKRQRIMINQLYVMYHELGRVPTSPDITEASKQNKCSSLRTIQFRFGSFNAYLEAARLPINRRGAQKTKELSLKEKAPIRRVAGNEAVADLQFLTWFLGRRFTGAEVGRLSRLRICRSVITYKRALGVSTFEEALKLAKCWEEEDVRQTVLQGTLLISIREIQEIFGIFTKTTQNRIWKGLWTVQSRRHSAKGGRAGIERLLGMRQVFAFWEERQGKYSSLAVVARNLKERRKFWKGDL